MKSTILKLSVLGLALFEISCQSLPYQPYARDVKKRPEIGGVVALKTDHRDEDLSRAKSMMAKNCNGNGVRILEEGEVVIGEKTNSQTDQNSYRDSGYRSSSPVFISALGANSNSTTQSAESTTTQLKEWQITYECLKPEGAKTAEVSPGEGSTSQGKAPKKNKAVHQ